MGRIPQSPGGNASQDDQPYWRATTIMTERTVSEGAPAWRPCAAMLGVIAVSFAAIFIRLRKSAPSLVLAAAAQLSVATLVLTPRCCAAIWPSYARCARRCCGRQCRAVLLHFAT